MKYSKKLPLLSLLIMSSFIGAMDRPQSPARKAVEAAKAQFVIEEFNPNRDKKEVIKLIKDAWQTYLSGTYTGDESRKWIVDNLVNPISFGEDSLKFVDVARNAQAPEGSKILGLTTYYFAPRDDKQEAHVYIETNMAKDPQSNPHRKLIEAALVAQTIARGEPMSPRFYVKHIRDDNTTSKQVFSEAGFEEVKRGKSKDGADWLVVERRDKKPAEQP